jgi:hypothetical protein
MASLKVRSIRTMRVAEGQERAWGDADRFSPSIQATHVLTADVGSEHVRIIMTSEDNHVDDKMLSIMGGMASWGGLGSVVPRTVVADPPAPHLSHPPGRRAGRSRRSEPGARGWAGGLDSAGACHTSTRTHTSRQHAAMLHASGVWGLAGGAWSGAVEQAYKCPGTPTGYLLLGQGIPLPKPPLARCLEPKRCLMQSCHTSFTATWLDAIVPLLLLVLHRATDYARRGEGSCTRCCNSRQSRAFRAPVLPAQHPRGA